MKNMHQIPSDVHSNFLPFFSKLFVHFLFGFIACNLISKRRIKIKIRNVKNDSKHKKNKGTTTTNSFFAYWLDIFYGPNIIQLACYLSDYLSFDVQNDRIEFISNKESIFQLKPMFNGYDFLWAVKGQPSKFFRRHNKNLDSMLKFNEFWFLWSHLPVKTR